MLSLWPELQLEDDRLGFALSLFADEINYTSLICYIGLPLYMQSMLQVRIYPIYKMENPSKFIVDLQIDNIGWNTLREKLPRFVRLRYIIWHAKERQQGPRKSPTAAGSWGRTRGV